MILDLRKYEDFPVRELLDIGPSQVRLFRDDVKKIISVLIDLSIQKSGEEYFCRGKITALVMLECSRCLEETSTELFETADFIICSANRATVKDKNIVDDEDYVYYQGDELRVDLSDIIHQTLILALPMKPLCSETCRGLCPRCGMNLNTGRCNCRVKEPDERWRGLRNLFNQ